jgi:hypothetical protein
MTRQPATPRPSLNARVGALALALGAPLNLVLHLEGGRLAPLSYVAWLAVSFGLWCFAGEMGAARPLNRAGLVLLAAAFCADTLAMLATDPGEAARARLVYAFAVLGALVFWSVALMHRTRAARAIGTLGATVGAGALVLLVAAHLLLGTATILGASQLFAALDQPAHAASAALAMIDSVLCVWSLTTAWLLWRGRLAA